MKTNVTEEVYNISHDLNKCHWRMQIVILSTTFKIMNKIKKKIVENMILHLPC